MACKFQEIYYPHLSNFLKSEFSFDDYNFIENAILTRLDFEIFLPFDINYVSILRKFLDLKDDQVKNVIYYLKVGQIAGFIGHFSKKALVLGLDFKFLILNFLISIFNNDSAKFHNRIYFFGNLIFLLVLRFVMT